MMKHGAMGLLSLVVGMLIYKFLNGLYYDGNPVLKELANSEFKQDYRMMSVCMAGAVAGLIAGIGWFPSVQAAVLRLWGPLFLTLLSWVQVGHVLPYLAVTLLAAGLSAALSCVDWRKGTEVDW